MPASVRAEGACHPMALTTPITRTGLVQAVAQGQTAGTVQVQLAVQPTTAAPASTATLILSTAEWNAIVTEQGAGGASGIGVSLAITLQ